MAWPTSYTNLASQFIGKNGSLPSILAFGTDGAYPGVIVRNIRATPMIEEVKVEQGGGLTATHFIINDGDEVEFTVVDDRAVTFPLSGTPATLINPQPNGTSGTSELFQVINNNYNVAAKAPGERVILAKKYSLITPTQM